MPSGKLVTLPRPHPSQSSQKPVDHTFNLPNFLTLFRMALVPLYVLLFSEPTVIRSIAAASVFGLAAFTDFLDGYLARRRGQITQVGQLLDPLADKFLVISGLILLVQFQRIDAWLAIAFIIRELGITGVRAVAVSKGLIIEAGQCGKYKVVLQVIGIFILTIQGAWGVPFLGFYLLGTWLLYLALIFSLVSAGQYLWKFWHTLVGNQQRERWWSGG